MRQIDENDPREITSSDEFVEFAGNVEIFLEKVLSKNNSAEWIKYI